MVTCPVCARRAVGKVGADQFYCWDCCVEFVVRGPRVTIFNVEPDGSLTLYADPLAGGVNLGMQEGGYDAQQIHARVNLG